MASAGYGLKRPHDQDDPDGLHKRSRSNNGSPAPPASQAPITAKTDISKAMENARARATEVAARLAQAKGQAGSTNGAAPAGTTNSLQDRVAEMKARVAAAKERAAAVASAPRTSTPSNSAYQPPQHEDTGSKARGGLDVGLHPALLGDTSSDHRSGNPRQAMQPKFATTMANRKTGSGYTQHRDKRENQLDLSGPSMEEIKGNPYFDTSLAPNATVARGRIPRKLLFNEQGKYIQQASALRRQAALEGMKKRIAESARKAGMIDDMESERAFMVPEPPEIEWWDEALVNGDDYSNIDTPNGTKIDSEDSVVTNYVQHPVAIEPPQEKIIPAPKAMYLTPKEQKKKRKHERMARLKEKQAEIRLGLRPPEPPKVKKSNMMTVLGEEAVRDPTAVEARVNREIAERKATHEQMNQGRALTKEERREKLENQQLGDASKGIHCTVYRIDSLANGQHRFKVSRNAEQHALTGICILHPKFCLVIVEGGQHSINKYKKLMLNRIDWTENAGPASVREGNREASLAWLQAADEQGNIKNLGLNKCTLVWEGEAKARGFRKWGSKVCETDKDAKDALSRAKMENFWTLAKSYGVNEDG